MPPKKLTKLTKVETSSDDNTSDSENETMGKSIKTLKKTVVKNPESDDDGEDESDVVKKKHTKLAKAEVIEDDSEEMMSDSNSESESESDTDKKSKEKKTKESFDELTKRLDSIQVSIKTVDKDISETEKLLKVKEKMRNDYERQRNSILKVLSKTHNDEVTKARKEKPKRKGNMNGGFNKDQPVPDVLKKFLGLSPDVVMKRPQVMSALNNKFTELGLKKGQETILDKTTVKELELDKSYEGKVIRFVEFQTFLKGFYPTKEDKNAVSIA